MTVLGSSHRNVRIETAVLRIADELWHNRGMLGPSGFASGAVGGALFFAYANRALPGRGFDVKGCDLLQEAVDALDGNAGHDWIGGFPGAAWAANLAGSLLPGSDAVVAMEEHDARLLEVVEAGRIDDTHYDPLYGWSSVLVYAAQRPNTELGRQLGTIAYQRLLDASRTDAQGTYWLELPEHFAPARLRESGPPSMREFLEATLALHPQGRCNLGLAHGNPGVIGCLSAALHAGCVPPQAADMLGGACDWLLACRRHESMHRSAFASYKGDEGDSRLAWCYGDPGICLQLFHAARVLRRPDLAVVAHEVATHAARRDASEGKVNNAGLCHGSAGLARIFTRAAQYSGDAALAARAGHWLDHTLDLQQPTDAQHAFLFQVELDVMGPVAGALEGSAGVGLALLAAIDEGPADWDRAMLMSI
jgi:hypothetical protein